jgi:hypothetical protein
VSSSQDGVQYYAVNESGKRISSDGTGNGESIELDLLPGELVEGPNKLRVSAGFPGCDRQFLPGEFVVNFVSSLAVNSAGDVSICEGEDVTLQASGAPVGGFYKWFNGDGTLIPGATTNSLLVEDVLREEVFYVSAAHPNGCESPKAEVHIYPDTLKMPVVLIKDDTLYTEVVAFYQWRKDGANIAGATLPYFIPTEAGSYTVVASQEGCVKESAPYIYSTDGIPGAGGDPADDGQGGDPVTGIENGNTAEFDLQVYPIPSSGRSINVVLRSPGTEPVLIEIIDLLGRLHFSRQVDAGAAHAGVTIQPSTPLYEGLYFLRATQGDTKARRKVIVKD